MKQQSWPLITFRGGAVALDVELLSPTTGWPSRETFASASLGSSDDGKSKLTYHTPYMYRGDLASFYVGLVDVGAIDLTLLHVVCMSVN